jgi:hypothetical protein
MRKKSHIALAKGVVEGLSVQDVFAHRLTFYIGSIWPDCIPSFIVKRHCVGQTLDIWNKRLDKFILKYKKTGKPLDKLSLLSTWRLGIVLHYVADYFTFPHNEHYEGSMKEHCAYEEILKRRMRSYVADITADSHIGDVRILPDKKHLEEFILLKHNQYMNIDGNVDTDCRYAVLACMTVVATLFDIVTGGGFELNAANREMSAAA